MSPKRLEEAHDVSAYERLAASEAELTHAEAHEGGAKTVHLLDRQHFGFRQESHVLRHAVDAAEIAPVRYRDSQIRDPAAERVDDGDGHRGTPIDEFDGRSQL